MQRALIIMQRIKALCDRFEEGDVVEVVVPNAVAVQWIKHNPIGAAGISLRLPIGTRATVSKTQEDGSSDVKCTVLGHDLSLWLLQCDEIDVSRKNLLIFIHLITY